MEHKGKDTLYGKHTRLDTVGPRVEHKRVMQQFHDHSSLHTNALKIARELHEGSRDLSIKCGRLNEDETAKSSRENPGLFKDAPPQLL